MAEQVMLARLKPYNKRRGHVLRIVNYRGIKFEGTKGWYRVDDQTAAYLASVHQDPYDEDSPQAFDVMPQEQARALENAENKKAEEKAKAADPIDAALDRSATVAADLPAVTPEVDKPSRRMRRNARDDS